MGTYEDVSPGSAGQREFDKIRSMLKMSEEMRIEPQVLTFDASRPLPNRSQVLRQLLNLFRADLPCGRRLLRPLIAARMPGIVNCAMEPGFQCLYGNVFAEGVSFSNTKIIDYAGVHVGRGTGFSFDNLIITSTHGLPDFDRVIAAEVIIGENVWITSRVTILGGVKIGHNSIIAAGSVVTSDIPPNVTAGGVPARVISNKHR